MRITLKDNDLSNLKDSDLKTVIEAFRIIHSRVNSEKGVFVTFDTDLDSVIGWYQGSLDKDITVYKVYVSLEFLYKYEVLGSFNKLYFLLVLESLDRGLYSPSSFKN